MIEGILLAAHVVAGILFVGPVAVTTSMFPRVVPSEVPAAEAAMAGGGGGAGAVRAAARMPGRPRESAPVAATLHRITRTYAVAALAVPVLGLVLAAAQGRLTEVWIVAAMVLTAVAGGLLALRIVPLQGETLTRPATAADLRALRSLTGIFNLLWVTVVVLMVLRPGAYG
ncbi:hypothetical protein QFZ62_002727 [Clavibacter sp. B3I6]|uniref:hypothetical protein n=1 Tax=Clavibacter sp. B3I6 TaxID=3042268 RepID=UPI00278B0409|nr:hypothetical protein [Clavibacter sp. B3I6]MDQ0745419.1 hypothetical protein [Clavibacter sp. B3I6]